MKTVLSKCCDESQIARLVVCFLTFFATGAALLLLGIKICATPFVRTSVTLTRPFP